MYIRHTLQVCSTYPTDPCLFSFELCPSRGDFKGAYPFFGRITSPDRLPPRDLSPATCYLPRTLLAPCTLHLRLHHDGHVRPHFPDSAAPIIPSFVENLYQTTTVVAHRRPIRFGVFLVLRI